MKLLDLFSGIGGFSLGLERAGMKTAAFCEIDPFCRRVLAKHWPEVPIYDDIRTLTAARLAAARLEIDIICGGFPCQDISFAGRGAGLAGARSGLWSEFARIIGEVRPVWVVIENVSALLGRGLGTVLGDLAALGFDCVWHCIPASAIGAPHRRDRVWVIARRNDYGSCQVIRGDEGLRRLWRAVSAAGGCCEETDPWKILLSQMQLRRPIRDGDDRACCFAADVLRAGYDIEGNRSGARGGLEADRQAVDGNWGSVAFGPTPSAREKIGGEISTGGNGGGGADDPERGGRTSSGLQRDERQSTEPCRCIEAAAFRFAQAIGSSLGETLRPGSDFLRSMPWVSAERQVGGVDEINETDSDCGIPASSIGAPHRRDRVWIVANADGARLEIGPGTLAAGSHATTSRGGIWDAEPIMGGTIDGVPSRLDRFAAWEGGISRTVGRGYPDRRQRLTALGNSVVPQIPEIIGRAIMAAEATR